MDLEIKFENFHVIFKNMELKHCTTMNIDGKVPFIVEPPKCNIKRLIELGTIKPF